MLKVNRRDIFGWETQQKEPFQSKSKTIANN